MVLTYIAKTNRSVFLTGKAETGKTTLLHRLKAELPRSVLVIAPTAVAATNSGGVTIHSFFQIPFGPLLPDSYKSHLTSKFNQEKLKVFQALEILIIDEISMVRADTVDYMDEVLRQTRNSLLPFGNVQVIMIGDLFQLPPVVYTDWPVLQKFYTGPYFFESHVYNNWNIIVLELNQVFRQNDPTFLTILNQVREGYLQPELLETLNKQYQPEPYDIDSSMHRQHLSYTYLTSRK